MSTHAPNRPRGSAATGLACSLGAYLFWGVIPLYFRAVKHIGPVELVVHRVIWSCLLLLLMIVVMGKGRDLVAALSDRKALATLALSASLISINWMIYIYSVISHQVLQSSLGYFICPLMNIVLGVVVLRESLGRRRWIAVGLAGAGVLNMALVGGQFPWIAVSLALTFSLYTLVRKQVAVDAVIGLSTETLILLVPSSLAFALWTAQGTSSLGSVGFGTDALLIGSSLVTVVPLVLCIAGARRLPLSTIGFLQYLAPSMQFVLAITVFEEFVDAAKLSTFALIWVAVALYSFETARKAKAERAGDKDRVLDKPIKDQGVGADVEDEQLVGAKS